MNVNQMCLLGTMLLHYVVLQDCTTRQGDISSIFVKTSDAIVFHFDEHNGHFNIEQFTFSRMQSDRRKEICRFDIMADYPSGYLYRENCSSNSNNRTSVVFIDADRDYMIFDVTISKAEKADNGTYMIVSEFSPWISKCFTVFILGQPNAEIKVTPPVIESGTPGRLSCISISTTVPATHNLTIQTSWLVKNTSVESTGRFQIVGNDLIIHYVTRLDNNLTVSCQVVEERGLTTFANTTLQVGWGPDPIPELQPPNTFYNLESGAYLQPITCSSDCNPQCDFTWEKIDSQRLLSIDGVLTMEKLESVSSGEYVCIAKRNQTNKLGRISVIISVKEAVGGNTQTYTQNYTPVTLIGAVLGAALLSAIVFIVVLLRRGSKSKTTAAEMELQNTRANYDGLSQRNNAASTYDEMNLGMDDCVSKTTVTGKDVYENRKIRE